jgi:methyl-accepting chemotaxis protein
MQWFINLKVKSKLLLSLGFIIVLLAILTITSYRNIIMISAAHEKLYQQDFMVSKNFAELEKREYAIRLALINMLDAPTRELQNKAYLDLQNHSKAIEIIYPTLVNLAKNDRTISQQLKILNEIRVANKATRDQQVIPLILQGKIDEARKFEALQNTRFEKMRNIISTLLQEARDRASMGVLETKNKSREAAILIITISTIALLFSIFITWFLNYIISTPLNHLSRAAKRITLGDLNISTHHIQRNDEIGILSNAFHAMHISLKNTADLAKKISEGDLRVHVTLLSEKDNLSKALKDMINSLRNITLDINKTVSSLSTVSGELSASSIQLVDSATETATSVSETTTTLEEVRQTAQLANEKAQGVAERSQKTENITENGKKAAEEIRTGINLIRNQMESIANSMVRLSEQTQMIGTVITTVDDLAQQSNLLAVNASIEAAKAGEQGKGFAVVAQEVKSLADQSKKATNQVRTILNDIQKATSDAVMATEQGTKAVKIGIQKSTQAGESISILSENAKESVQAATQIAATTHQQLIGMEQTTIAMENIKQASQQNAASASQLESAVNNINELSIRLKEIVSRFKIQKNKIQIKEVAEIEE